MAFVRLPSTRFIWQVETKHLHSQHRPNISYLRWRLDHPRRPPESHSIAATEPTRAPPSLPAVRIARPISCSSTYALHLPDSPRKYLTSGTLQTLVDSTQIQLFPRSTASPRGSRIVLWVACSERLYHHADKVTLHL